MTLVRIHYESSEILEVLEYSNQKQNTRRCLQLQSRVYSTHTGIVINTLSTENQTMISKTNTDEYTGCYWWKELVVTAHNCQYDQLTLSCTRTLTIATDINQKRRLSWAVSSSLEAHRWRARPDPHDYLYADQVHVYSTADSQREN